MKLIKLSISLLIVISFTISSCKDDDPNPVKLPNTSGNKSISDSLSVSINGMFFDMDTYNVNFRNGIIKLKATDLNGEVIYLTIDGQSIGSYTLTQNWVNTIIYTNQDSTVDYWSTAASGQIILTKVDTVNKTISGSFASNNLVDGFRGLTTNMTNGYFQDLSYNTSLFDLGNMSAKINGVQTDIPFAYGAKAYLSYNGTPISTLVFGNHKWIGIPENIEVRTDSAALSIGSYNITQLYTGSTQSGGGGKPVSARYLIAGKEYYSINGTLNVLGIDHTAKKMNGTFTFQAVNGTDTINITEGNFNTLFE